MKPFSHASRGQGSLPQDSMPRESALVNTQIADNLNRLLGPEIFENVVNLFVDQATNALEEIHRAVSVESRDEIVSLSHKMKGSASTVGCDFLADLYGKIEIATKNEESNELAQLTNQLQNATPESLDALRYWITTS